MATTKTPFFTPKGQRFISGILAFVLVPLGWILIFYTNLWETHRFQDGYDHYSYTMNSVHGLSKLWYMFVVVPSTVILTIICFLLVFWGNYWLMKKIIKEKTNPGLWLLACCITEWILLFIFTM